MYIIKEAEEDKKDIPFLGYAKKQGLDNEKQVKALLAITSNKTAKGKEQNTFGPEDMAELWKNFKDMIKNNK
jgi:hypothetical protein